MTTWENERGPNYLSQHCARLECKWCAERRARAQRAATVINMEEAARRLFDSWEAKIGPRYSRQQGDVALNWSADGGPQGAITRMKEPRPKWKLPRRRVGP